MTSQPQEYSPEQIAAYYKVRSAISMDEKARDNLKAAYYVITKADSTVEQVNAALDKAYPAMRKADGTFDIDAVLKASGAASIDIAMQGRIKFHEQQIDRGVKEAFTIAKDVAEVDFFNTPMEDRPKEESLVDISVGGQTFHVKGETAARIAADQSSAAISAGVGYAGIAQRAYEYNNLSAGDKARLAQDLFQFNNLSAYQVTQIDQQLRTDGRLDKQFAFEVTNAQRTYDEGIRQFNSNYALSKLGVEAQFQGLELTRKGQMINALGTDMANQIALGRMTFDEAQLNLDRLDKAVTQRREDQKIVLEYGVTKASLYEKDGQLMSRLPGGAQLAQILSAATGQTFAPDAFDIAAGTINPDKTAQAILEGSNFQSPIPNLTAQLERSRNTISQILGQPINAPLIADQATSQITQGVNKGV